MFLYHTVPEQLIGETLVPLNTLKKERPSLYEQHIRKYVGREQVLNTYIPQLNCAWQDVVFLSPVSPRVFRKVFDSIGIGTNGLRSFEIDAECLDQQRAVVLFYEKNGHECFLPFTPKELATYAHVPPQAIAHYKKTIQRGGIILVHHLVPHILYQGTIDVRDVKIVEA